VTESYEAVKVLFVFWIGVTGLTLIIAAIASASGITHVSGSESVIVALLLGTAITLVFILIVTSLVRMSDQSPDNPQPEVPGRHSIPLTPTPPVRHYITFSDRGIKNGLAQWPNDGFDFGPDTPNTHDNGRTEALELGNRIQMAVVGPLSSDNPTTQHLLRTSPPVDTQVEP
jgi:hypothetical protein